MHPNPGVDSCDEPKNDASPQKSVTHDPDRSVSAPAGAREKSGGGRGIHLGLLPVLSKSCPTCHVERSRDIWPRIWHVVNSRPDFSAPTRLPRASGRNDNERPGVIPNRDPGRRRTRPATLLSCTLPQIVRAGIFAFLRAAGIMESLCCLGKGRVHNRRCGSYTHRGNEIEAFGLLGIWLDIQRR